MTRINADVVIALLLLTLSAVFFVDTFELQRAGLSIIGAKLWPRVVMVVLGVLALVYLVQSAKAPTAAPIARRDAGTWLGDNRNVLACFALYALFLVTLPWLGMLLGGVLFVFATLTALGERNMRAHGVHFLIALGSVGLMWAIFTFALGVILPEGEILPR